VASSLSCRLIAAPGNASAARLTGSSSSKSNQLPIDRGLVECERYGSPKCYSTLRREAPARDCVACVCTRCPSRPVASSRCPSPAFLQRTFWREPAEILPQLSPDAPLFIESFCRTLESLMPGSACAITV